MHRLAELRSAGQMRDICPYVVELRHPHRFGGERRSGALRRLSLPARAQQLSFNAQSIQKLRVSR